MWQSKFAGQTNKKTTSDWKRQEENNFTFSRQGQTPLLSKIRSVVFGSILSYCQWQDNQATYKRLVLYLWLACTCTELYHFVPLNKLYHNGTPSRSMINRLCPCHCSSTLREKHQFCASDIPCARTRCHLIFLALDATVLYLALVL